jgi:hypothetical protein
MVLTLIYSDWLEAEDPTQTGAGTWTQAIPKVRGLTSGSTYLATVTLATRQDSGHQNVGATASAYISSIQTPAGPVTIGRPFWNGNGATNITFNLNVFRCTATAVICLFQDL